VPGINGTKWSVANCNVAGKEPVKKIFIKNWLKNNIY